MTSPKPEFKVGDIVHWRYAVGWLADQQIRRFGDNFETTFERPGQAQWLLNQIAANNSASNLKMLCGGGPERLFIIEVHPVWPQNSNPWESTHKRRYIHNGHIIPELSRFIP